MKWIKSEVASQNIHLDNVKHPNKTETFIQLPTNFQMLVKFRIVKGTWVAQSVKRFTPDFGGHDLTVL